MADSRPSTSGSDERSAARRRAPLVLAILVLLLVLLRAALPKAVELGLEGLLSDVLVIGIEIDDVDLTLQEGRIELEGIQLRALDTGAELGGARRITLDLDWGAAFSGLLEAEHLEIQEPTLLLDFDADGRFNWTGVGDTPDEPEAAADAPAPSFRLKIAHAELGAGELHLSDQVGDGLGDLRLRMGGFRLAGAEIERPEPGAALQWGLAEAEATSWQIGLAPDQPQARDYVVRAFVGPAVHQQWIPLELEVERENGLRMELEGKLRPDPLGIEAQVRWEGLRSSGLLPLLSLRRAHIVSGRSKGSFAFSLDLDDVPERGVRLSGELELEDLVLETEDEPPARIEVARASAELAELRIPISQSAESPPEPVFVHWARIEIEDPLLELMLSDRPEDESGADAPTGEPNVDLRVDAFLLHGGRLRWRDPILGADHDQEITSIELETTSFRWPRIRFDRWRLVMGSLGTPPLRIEGTWLPGAADVSLRATRVPLAPWGPLISYYNSDYSVSRGHLSMKGRFRLRGEAYDATLDLTLHQLRAESEGVAFQKTFGMSLATAIPLLSDTAGNINLKLPIQGSLSEDVQIDLEATTASALREATRNALTNALATPATLTHSVLRRVGEVFLLGIGEAAFRPGKESIELDARLVLDSAGALVARTPGAGLRLIPEIVNDDLVALGVAERPAGVGGTISRLTQSLTGRGPEIDTGARAQLTALANRRLDDVARQLREESGLAPDRIIRTPWEGEVRDGVPRVLLRLVLR